MIRIFLYQLKIILNNKTIIFWTLLFPVILGTLFYFAFGNLYSEESVLKTIDVAVVDETENAEPYQMFQAAAEELEYSDGTEILNITYTDSSEAEALLKDEAVTGVITVKNNGDITLLVKESGIYESVLSGIIAEYHKFNTMINEISVENPQALEKALSIFYEGVDVNVTDSHTEGNKDPYVTYFYNLIAMMCLFSSFSGLGIVVNCQRNQSDVGLRVNVSPVKTVFIELAGIAAAFLVQLVCVLLGLFYLITILGVNFGGEIINITITSVLCTMLGVSIGYLIGHVGKGGLNTKIGILTGVELFCCFLSGLMVGNMKILVQKHCPIVNKINPSAVLEDAFYAQNIYGAGERFYGDLILIAVITVVLLIVGSIMAGRNKYASV